MEISKLFHHWDFMWNQFCEFLNCKNCHFCHFRGYEFCSFGKYQPSNSVDIQNIQNSEPLNVLKWLILHFKNPQKRFHVKSEWYKNHDISTLFTRLILKCNLPFLPWFHEIQKCHSPFDGNPWLCHIHPFAKRLLPDSMPP